MFVFYLGSLLLFSENLVGTEWLDFLFFIFHFFFAVTMLQAHASLQFADIVIHIALTAKYDFLYVRFIFRCVTRENVEYVQQL